jgi:hypothetical protein
MSLSFAHLYADHGVESEVLSRIGSVTRFTLDAVPTPFVDETVEIDLSEETPSGSFDLALLHPRCTDKSDMTSISGDPDRYSSQISRAREIGKTIADDYIIENKPREDLRETTTLSGRMFGLPIDYTRSFETSFRVESPPKERRLGEKTVTPYYYSDRSREWWETVKGYRGEYPKEHLAKNALPSIYVSTLLRSWLESRQNQDSESPQDNNSPRPKRLGPDQVTLADVGGGRDR